MTQLLMTKSLSASLLFSLVATPAMVLAGEHGRGSWIVSAPNPTFAVGGNRQELFGSRPYQGYGSEPWHFHRINPYARGWGVTDWGGAPWHNPQSSVYHWNNSGWNSWKNHPYASRRHGWAPYYGYHDPYYRGPYYSGRLTKTDTAVLGVGIGIVGLAIAAAATSGKKKYRDSYENDRAWRNPDYDSGARPDRSGIYRPGIYRHAVEEPAYDPDLPPAFNSSCLQTREYQTTIMIGGKKQPVYGTACLQPDGTWRKGPPQVEP